MCVRGMECRGGKCSRTRIHPGRQPIGWLETWHSSSWGFPFLRRCRSAAKSSDRLSVIRLNGRPWRTTTPSFVQCLNVSRLLLSTNKHAHIDTHIGNGNNNNNNNNNNTFPLYHPSFLISHLHALALMHNPCCFLGFRHVISSNVSLLPLSLSLPFSSNHSFMYNTHRVGLMGARRRCQQGPKQMEGKHDASVLVQVNRELLAVFQPHAAPIRSLFRRGLPQEGRSQGQDGGGILAL